MTVYELIQDLAQCPPDKEVIVCVDGQGFFEELDTGKDRYVDIGNKKSTEIGISEIGGICYIDVTI